MKAWASWSAVSDSATAIETGWMSSLARGATTPEEVVEIVYADVDPAVKWAALWSVRAQLDYLR